MGAYLTQISKIPLLTAGQERALAQRITAGLSAAQRLRRTEELTEELCPRRRQDLHCSVRDGEHAKIDLVQAHLCLVVSVAKRHTGAGMPLLDLIQEGNLGLVRAAERFDYTRGCPFSLYATYWIRHAIIQALVDQARVVRLPAHLIKLINRWGCVHRDLVRHLGRKLTPDELANKMGLTRDDVLDIQRYAQEPISLDQALEEHGDALVEEFLRVSPTITGLEVISATLVQTQIHTALATLSEGEASIIRLRFGLLDGQPRTIEEISRAQGLTRRQIRQIEAQAITRLRRCGVLRDRLD